MDSKSAESSAKPPRFKTETEEADWYHSQDGQRFLDNLPAKKMIVTEKREMDDELRALMKSGFTVRFKNGMNVQRTDPAKLQALVERVQAKGTQPVSIRLAKEDLAAAKKLADQHGIAYQTLLKEIIHDALLQMAEH